MKVKRLAVHLLCFAVLFLYGCQQQDSGLSLGVEYYDCGLVFRVVQGVVSWDYMEPPFEDGNTDMFCLDDQKLQQAAKARTQGAVLDNDSDISTYAWDLLPILTDHSYIPSDFYPINAEHYANGIVMILYADDSYVEKLESVDRTDWGHYTHGEILVFVSETDGQIIHITSY